MPAIGTSGLMSGERKRATASRPRTAPFLDSTEHQLNHASRRVGTRQTESLRHFRFATGVTTQSGAETRLCRVGTRADTWLVRNPGLESG
jgi:hypothetical protein